MRILACAAAAAALLLAACGDDSDDDGSSGDDQKQVRVVATDLANATAEADGEAACALLTDRYREEVEEGSGVGCDESFEPLPGQKAGDGKYPQIVRVSVTGDIADVGVRPSAEVVCGYAMSREDGEWLVDGNVCFKSKQGEAKAGNE